MAIRCRKSARRCGAKHISKSNVSKTEGFEPLFDDSMAIPCQQLQQVQQVQLQLQLLQLQLQQIQQLQQPQPQIEINTESFIVYASSRDSRPPVLAGNLSLSASRLRLIFSGFLNFYISFLNQSFWHASLPIFCGFSAIFYPFSIRP